MRELSLFTGAGGGLLGTHLLGWTPIGYVEYDDYCQRVIRQRIDDGILNNAPIFGDIRTFISDGYAASYQGLVDVITAGFPCQPFSAAGKQLGADDPRNMWPATIECIRQVRPRYAFLENVPALLSSGYFGTALGDLAAAGYDTRWCVLGGADVGNIADGKRLWVVATSPNGAMLESLDFYKPESLVRKNHSDGNLQEQSARCFNRMITPESNEALMNWPEGWSDSKPLATARFREWLQQHGGC